MALDKNGKEIKEGCSVEITIKCWAGLSFKWTINRRGTVKGFLDGKVQVETTNDLGTYLVDSDQIIVVD